MSWNKVSQIMYNGTFKGGNNETFSPVVWDIIGTEFDNFVPFDKQTDVPNFGTNVPISEGLLRNILPLTEYHQLAIVSDLINGCS